MAGPGRRTRQGATKMSKPLHLNGADETMPVVVEEGQDTEGTLANLIEGLEKAGVIVFDDE